MKLLRFLIGLFATLASSYAQPGDLQRALTSAMNWYYRWMEPIPREIASIECSVITFTGKSFAFCEPINLSMNIETPENQSPRVSYIGPEKSFDVALAGFRRNINPDGRQTGPVRKFFIAVRNLGGCRIDNRLTVHAAAVALTKEVRAAMLESGHSFRYPFVCDGDPFYMVYCLNGEDLLWIWLYELDGDRVELRWSFDKGTQQRALPKQAIINLTKKNLWYKAEPEKHKASATYHNDTTRRSWAGS